MVAQITSNGRYFRLSTFFAREMATMTRVDQIITATECHAGTFFHQIVCAFRAAIIEFRGRCRFSRHETLNTLHFLGGGFGSILLDFADTCS
jgi:hypothetical protein